MGDLSFNSIMVENGKLIILLIILLLLFGGKGSKERYYYSIDLLLVQAVIAKLI